jgi:hypothetical protein
MVFEPDRTLRRAPEDSPFAMHEVRVEASGDPQRTLDGWWIPSAARGAKVVLYLHGNDGNVSTNMHNIAPLRELGYAVFMIDYRGYGKSGGGFPSEAGVYEDAEAAWNFLARDRGVRPSDLFIYGHSLGGAIAIELALRHPESAGLIVESSFTSIYDMAMLETRYSVLPIKAFLNQRFESIAKVGKLALPVLYIHGTADATVPFDMGQALFAATPSARAFIAVPAADHENNAEVGGAMLRSALSRFVDDAAGPGRVTLLASREGAHPAKAPQSRYN